LANTALDQCKHCNKNDGNWLTVHKESKWRGSFLDHSVLWIDV